MTSVGRQSTGAARQPEVEAEALSGLVTHAGIYVVVVLFLAVLDVAGGGDLWFYWVALGWGLAVAIHAVTVLVPMLLPADLLARRAHLAGSSTSLQNEGIEAALERGFGIVGGIRARSYTIANPEVREQVLTICGAADRMLGALAEHPQESRLAREFLDRYLEPTAEIVDHYARLSARHISTAQPTLRQVETQDLPLIQQRMSDLYERVHQGDIIDLQVASEMLAMGLDPLQALSTPGATVEPSTRPHA